MYAILLSLVILFTQTTANIIHVSLTHTDGSGVVGEPIVFVHESGLAMGECLTDSNGRCDITLDDNLVDNTGFIRGWLDVGERGSLGRRAIIWRGGDITVDLSLQNGQLDIPLHLPHNLPTPTTEVTPIILMPTSTVVVPADGESIIQITVVGNDGRPQGGVRVVFEDATGNLTGQCFTKAYTGRCDITGLYAPPGLISGQLTVGAWGSRPVAWQGGILALLIDVADGELAFAQDDEVVVTNTPTTTAVSVIELLANQTVEATPESPPTPQPIIQLQRGPSPLVIILSTIFFTLLVVGMVGLLVYESRKGA
jgi:hypothetical protein